MNIAPVVLEGRVVRLEPMALEHVDALTLVGLDPSLWALTTMRIATRGDLLEYMRMALAEQAAGTALPFVTIVRATGEVIGSTRFANVVHEHARAEIGWTWITPRWQRTAVNTEAKYLMLRHAFEHMGCRRVELKTNALNARSRAAMLRIGATEEGTLRRHMINADGSPRDSVYFSVIAEEWPTVCARLEKLLA